MRTTAVPAPRRATGFPLAIMRVGGLWLAAFLGGFVFFEPAPYELFIVAMMGAWFACGLTVPRQAGPLIVLMLMFIAGGYLAMTQSTTIDEEPLYLGVSTFLALTACFFACVVATGSDRIMSAIVNGWIAGAVGSTVLGLIGYFGLAPGEMFTLYQRSAGGFQDPNVYGPFLIFPLLVTVQRALTRPFGPALLSGATAMFLLYGLFLSFSRGAWGVAVAAFAIVFLLLVVNERRPAARARYLMLAGVGLLLLAVMLVAALSADATGSLFAERARIVQYYDGGRTGRFERHLIGFTAMLAKPLGVGALEFGHIYKGDEHNIYLKALTTYGWLGFLSFVTLSIWTLAAAFRLLFRSGPYQKPAQAAYVTLLGHLVLGVVIDIDHWRHVYLLFGLLWGIIATARVGDFDRLRRLRVRPPAGYREVPLGA